MASCLLMTGVQLLGQGGNLTLWPCKYHFIAEHLPLLPATWGTWLLALGSNQPPDFQTMPALDSWLGCLRECRDRSELSPSEGDALAQQGLCKHQPQQEPVVTKLRPNCKTNTFQQGRVTDKIPNTFLCPNINPYDVEYLVRKLLLVGFPPK